MGKWQVIARVYGYVVCLTTVCWGLVALASVVESAFDLTDPLHSREVRYSARDLSSYEAFRLDALKAAGSGSAGTATSGGGSAGEGSGPEQLGLTDQAIRTMYDATKADTIRGAVVAARRELMKSAFVLVACVCLFVGHWRWLRRMPKGEG